MLLAYQFQGQTVKDQNHQAINADTHRAPYLPNGKAYELQTWYRWKTTTRIMTSKVKDQGHKLTSSVRLISDSY